MVLNERRCVKYIDKEDEALGKLAKGMNLSPRSGVPLLFQSSTSTLMRLPRSSS
jgi:hypothetical protein